MINLVGHQLGNYRVLRLLGRGGFADVYLGEQIHLKSHAALKVVRTQVNREQSAAFLQEARILAHLKHPYIVRVLDFAVEDDIAYLVLEHAPGGSLRTTFPRGTRVSLDVMLRIVRHVVPALQYAHDEGFVHRDVKPENLLWGSHGEVLLSDFGLAAFASNAQLYNDQDLAFSGASTSPYLAPEQLQGQPLPASDQYALGTMIYEWLTGMPPLHILQAALPQLSLSPSPLYTQPPDIPPAIEEVVLRALARDPGQRFASVRDLGIAMERAMQGTHAIMPAPLSLSSSTREILDFLSRKQSESPQTVEPVLRGNVPVFLTKLLGREQDIERVCAFLQRSDVRVLTLLGPGGVGKTRLSLAVAQRSRTTFRDGVCFVSLAPICDHQLVMSTIAQQLDVKEEGEQPILKLLIAALRDQQQLLVLDNMEQVVAAAPMLAELLAACPGLKLLISSRALLHLQGEHSFLVQPLALPDLAHLPEHEVLAQQAAVAMFLDRAQAMRPDFSLTADNASVIAEICVRLDGLPLAIELAAARIRLMPPKALLARLAQRLSVLTRGASSLPERQQTLRKTLQWSYDLLDIYEQRLFQYLSIFVSGFTLEAAEEICGELLLDGGETEGSVLDGLDSLLAKSLLRLVEWPAGESRLTMLDTIREYGLECLTASGELAIVRQKHATYYQALARKVGADINSPEKENWFRLLGREKDNLLAALNWLLEQGEIEQALRLCNDILWFWWARNYPREGRMFLERELTAHRSDEHDVWGWGLQTLGIQADNQGNLTRAVELWQVSLALFRKAGATLGIAWALSNIGIATMYQGEYNSARQFLEESLALFRGLEDQGGCGPLQIGSSSVSGGVPFTLFRLASIANIQGDYARARALAEESLPLLRAAGDSSRISPVLEILVLVALNQGDYARAQTFLAEKLTLDREHGVKRIIGTTISLQGQLALLQGKIDRAHDLLTESVAILKEIAASWMPSQDNLAEALSLLGRIIARQGNLAHAQTLHEESLAMARHMATPQVVAFSLEGLAEVAAQTNPARAARLWGAAETFRETRGTPLPAAWQQEYKRAIKVARSSLGAKVFSDLWATGRNLSLDQVLDNQKPMPLPPPSPPANEVVAPAAPSDAELPPAASAVGLTLRELEVLRLLALGLTSVQIAERLVLSTRTVNAHLRSIYSKLNVSSRVAAVRYAFDNQLV
ncbi:protein kinase domain-containing protein [Dictyobacter formicarum]|uniref:Protein kinase domain-containing protein n=1 Tax=Dictyobacter formicarum TaxID=2778368 RepID=A0ABQ3VBG3_9CHLR|nr:protein kinase [Dictyobacter formicarum]GHO83179.1 hypothetical protein KSZ_11850 [Dictyobacter formicarum]